MHDAHLHPEKTSHRALAWLVTMTSALFFFYEFIQMHVFSTINLELREAFHLDAEQIGQFFSMYFYANALCLFPVGNLIDRYSTKRMLLLAVFVCTVGTFMFALGTEYWVAASGRF